MQSLGYIGPDEVLYVPVGMHIVSDGGQQVPGDDIEPSLYGGFSLACLIPDSQLLLGGLGGGSETLSNRGIGHGASELT